MPFVSKGNEKLWITSKLVKIRFDWGRPGNLGYRYEERNQEEQQTRWCDPSTYADPSTWELLWDWLRHECLWICNKSCWPQSPHDLLLHAILSYGIGGVLYYTLATYSERTFKGWCLSCSNKEQRESPLADLYILHIPYVCYAEMYVTFKSLYVFRAKGPDTKEDK